MRNSKFRQFFSSSEGDMFYLQNVKCEFILLLNLKYLEFLANLISKIRQQHDF